mmetsp:Transcript_20413/g.45437  ORF Transcript_20413/g.45437 Transcript_20413/m.45437 type:complete len:177 (-) Transcript_20413:129-659(-)
MSAMSSSTGSVDSVAAPVQKSFTTHNASTSTAFEIRQELLRRDAMDLDADKCNYKSLLQRLMVELVKEENETAEQNTTRVVDEAAAARERAKEERDLKKREALERSQARQADPEYFARRAATNEQAAQETKAKAAAAAAVEELEVQGEGGDDEEEEEEEANPFRTTKKGRSKIFVK